MAVFDPDTYRQHRIFYPSALFEPLKPVLGPRSDKIIRVLDLGAGTGNSAWSFRQFYPGEIDFTLIDPDPAMLERVPLLDFGPGTRVRTRIASSHEIKSAPPDGSLEQSHFDIALAGSAWHWMHPSETIRALEARLLPGGAFFVFEYRFPRVTGGGDAFHLNEWIRRNFNLHWKTPDQKPRGSLRELTEPLRAHDSFCERASVECVGEFEIDPEGFAGVVVSQSRYLAYERTLPDEAARGRARSELIREIKNRWPESRPMRLHYEFQGFLFARLLC
jgi:SAM-dependent methyltransferase